MIRLLVMILSLIILSPPSGSAHADGTVQDSLFDYRDSPVYFERYRDLYFKYELMPSFRENRLKVANFPEVDVTGFDWVDGGIDDDSWWSGAERLIYLLPFIDSENKADQELAKKWFLRWYDCHQDKHKLHKMAWGDPFVAAYRAMVLVFFLKTEEGRANPDAGLISALLSSISEHQDYLAGNDAFDVYSNQGIVEALALIEVSRVMPGPKLIQLGVDRVLTMLDVSLSDLGCHLEHSPAYHFGFLRLVTEIYDYCRPMRFLPSGSFERIAECRERMLRATYFLHDHQCNIPQIGDSDFFVAGEMNSEFCINEPDKYETTLYDPQAGYAIYKGHPSTGDRRYVVFTNQSRRPRLPYHFHDDALAVFYSYDGEVVLGDQGKYEYTYSIPRRYFASPAAHNTIFLESCLTQRKGRYYVALAEEPGCAEGSEGIRFHARMRHGWDLMVERSVVIHEDGETVGVFDNITRLQLPESTGTSGGSGGPESTLRRQLKQVRNQSARKLVMVWNVGRDVRSIRSQEPEEDGAFVYVLETRSGRWFRMSICFEGDFDVKSLKTELAVGKSNPMLGWYSPSHLVMKPLPTLVIEFDPTSNMSISTLLELTSGDPSSGEILYSGD